MLYRLPIRGLDSWSPLSPNGFIWTWLGKALLGSAACKLYREGAEGQKSFIQEWQGLLKTAIRSLFHYVFLHTTGVVRTAVMSFIKRPQLPAASQPPCSEMWLRHTGFMSDVAKNDLNCLKLSAHEFWSSQSLVDPWTPEQASQIFYLLHPWLFLKCRTGKLGNQIG